MPKQPNGSGEMEDPNAPPTKNRGRAVWQSLLNSWPRRSPYLRTGSRLADVIAAIQATGTYKFYKLDFAGWADRIAGDKTQASYWKRVLEEHPEFFRLDSDRNRASLVVRRQRQRRYSVDHERLVSKEEAELLPHDRVSRLPLTPDETETLVNVAVALHAAALERQRARRWWVPLIAAFLGALAGGVVSRIVPFGDPRIPATQSPTRPAPPVSASARP